MSCRTKDTTAKLKERKMTSTNIPTEMFIGGELQAGRGAELALQNPATEEEFARFAGASTEQVDQAVAAARKAFDSGVWADPSLRKETILRFADLVQSKRDPLMEMLIDEVGTPASLKPNHVDTPVKFMRWYAEHGTKERVRQLGLNQTGTGVSTIVYRPVGVVAGISAFNYPLLIGLTKIALALSTGSTTILLGSPMAPLTILAMGELAREAGFPPGVVNFIAGSKDVGQALTSHPSVDKISFTGSVGVGREVMKQGAENLTDTVLELGGKSAAILLPGTDYKKFAFQLHARYARNAGQGCGSPTRILIEKSRYEEFCEASRDAYEKIIVGDPRDPATILGPVVSSAQRDRIESAVDQAVSEGAEIIAGGGRPDFEKGWFVNPALIGNVDNSAWIARNELFGPVSVVLTYETVDEAVDIANDSELGLKAYIFGDRKQCIDLCARLRVGTVQINGGSPLRPDAPNTGLKLSGNGSEWGEDGLREFLVPQHIDVAV
jgi:aldehyde dehydrogenase (NAD+)/betaine-aldehyde dehydrogenase